MIMRRNDRQITDPAKLQNVIENCSVCRLAMQDEEGLYIVPLSFGYTFEEGKLTLYFHSAKEGRKISALKANPSVAFEMDCGQTLIEDTIPCRYICTFQSIIGTGTVTFIEDTEEKKKALYLMMKHQAGKEFTFTDEMTQIAAVFRLDVTSFTGKARE